MSFRKLLLIFLIISVVFFYYVKQNKEYHLYQLPPQCDIIHIINVFVSEFKKEVFKKWKTCNLKCY